MVFKDKFTIPLDSEGFVVDQPRLHALMAEHDRLCSEMPTLAQAAEQFQNPKGWQEVDGVALPSVSPWADLEPHHERLRSHYRSSDEDFTGDNTEVKKAVAEHFLRGPRTTWSEDPDSPQGNSCPCGLHGDRYCRSIGCPRS